MVVNLGSTVVARPPHGRFGYVASKARGRGDDARAGRRPRPGRHPRQLHPARASSRPSCADPPRTRSAPGSRPGLHFGRQALSAVGQGSDIAEAVAWLAGDGGRWVTGAVIDVDGGLTLGLSDAL